MYKNNILQAVLALALLGAGVGTAVAGDDVDKLIAHARAAAPVSIVADEDIVAGSFSVIEEFKDYSGDADADVSNLFELVSLGNEIQQIRQRPKRAI